jgi:hypothetical protein
MSSNSAAGRLGVALGTLAVVAVPIDLLAAQSLQRVRLLESLYVAVPVAVALGLFALLAARRARLAFARSVTQEGRRLVQAARLLAWMGTWAGVTAGVALAVYGVLRWAQ